MELTDYYFQKTNKGKVDTKILSSSLQEREYFIKNKYKLFTVFEDNILNSLAEDFKFGYIFKRPVYTYDNDYFFYDYYIPLFFLHININLCDFKQEESFYKYHHIDYIKMKKFFYYPCRYVYSHHVIDLPSFYPYTQKSLTKKFITDIFYSFNAPDHRNKKIQLI